MTVDGIRPGINDPEAYERTYRRQAHRLGYDLPVFYFTVGNAALPDTLYRIMPRPRRLQIRELALQNGNWDRVQEFYHQLISAASLQNGPVTAAARRILLRTDESYILRELDRIKHESAADELLAAHQRMVAEPRPLRLLIPRFTWHGAGNQYHRFLTGLLTGDLGVSYTDGKPVAEKIAAVAPNTALLNGIALFVVYVLAVPLGLYMAYYRGTAFDRWATLLTFVAFGLPAFWIATLLANFLTTPAFGMDYFASTSLGYGNVPEGTGWFTAIRIRGSQLLLPVICLAYPSLAYVSRHLRSAAIEEMERPYVRTAYMKGLSGGEVLWKHIFRNASFPLVTLLGSLLPGLLAGSVLIEQIFNLPGMGELLFQSATASNWPVVIALVLINGLLTIVGLVLADLGYALLDPRIKLGKLPPR